MQLVKEEKKANSYSQLFDKQYINPICIKFYEINKVQFYLSFYDIK